MKKLLCLLLCLMMVIPASASLALTSPVITSITGTFTPPKAGDEASTYPALKIPSGAPYEYLPERSTWYTQEDTRLQYPLTYYTFKEGQQYVARLFFNPKDNYDFVGSETPLKATIAGAKVDNVYSTHDMTYASIVVRFTIPLKLSKVSGLKVTASSAKKIEVSWKKLKSSELKKAKKIEIQVSKYSDFRTLVADKFVSSKKTSITISGLKKNTKYYVRVREYTKDKTGESVSAWSAVKNKKTLKK